MKKLLSGLIAAFLLSAGFVAVSAETATASCKPTKYVQCKPVAVSSAGSTKTTKSTKKPKIVVRVKIQGSVQPKGTLTVTIKGNGKSITQTYKISSSAKKTIIGPKLKKGTYTVTIKFRGAEGFNNSATSYKLKVKK